MRIINGLVFLAICLLADISCRQISKRPKLQENGASGSLLIRSGTGSGSLGLATVNADLKLSYDETAYNWTTQEFSKIYSNDSLYLFQTGKGSDSTPLNFAKHPTLQKDIKKHNIIVARLSSDGTILDSEKGSPLAAACYGYALEAKSDSLLLSTLDNAIDLFLKDIQPSLDLLGAGQLCVAQGGKIGFFNNQSLSANPYFTTQNFLDFLERRGLSSDFSVALKSASANSLGLTGRFSVGEVIVDQRISDAKKPTRGPREGDLYMRTEIVERKRATGIDSRTTGPRSRPPSDGSVDSSPGMSEVGSRGSVRIAWGEETPRAPTPERIEVGRRTVEVTGWKADVERAYEKVVAREKLKAEAEAKLRTAATQAFGNMKAGDLTQLLDGNLQGLTFEGISFKLKAAPGANTSALRTLFAYVQKLTAPDIGLHQFLGLKNAFLEEDSEKAYLGTLLGVGSFGRVHLVEITQNGVRSEIAMKVPHQKRDYDSNKINESAQTELELGRKSADDQHQYLIAVNNGITMMRLVRDGKSALPKDLDSMDKKALQDMRENFLEGLERMEKMKVIHGDLKPENTVFVGGRLVPADFPGIKREDIKEGNTDFLAIGSPYYRDPAVFDSVSSLAVVKNPFLKDRYSGGTFILRTLFPDDIWKILVAIEERPSWAAIDVDKYLFFQGGFIRNLNFKIMQLKNLIDELSPEDSFNLERAKLTEQRDYLVGIQESKEFKVARLLAHINPEERITPKDAMGFLKGEKPQELDLKIKGLDEKIGEKIVDDGVRSVIDQKIILIKLEILEQQKKELKIELARVIDLMGEQKPGLGGYDDETLGLRARLRLKIQRTSITALISKIDPEIERLTKVSSDIVEMQDQIGDQVALQRQDFEANIDEVRNTVEDETKDKVADIERGPDYKKFIKDFTDKIESEKVSALGRGVVRQAPESLTGAAPLVEPQLSLSEMKSSLPASSSGPAYTMALILYQGESSLRFLPLNPDADSQNP